MMSKANEEQKHAISHTGGVLLSAGAGSGKTFVLTEHVIYLTHQWLREAPKNDPATCLDFFKKRFKQIVLMTFTNKAAGEIELRVHKRFATELDSIASDMQPVWQIAQSCLSYLTITTIHGFCYKLIKKGFFESINPSTKLTSDSLYNKRIEEIFNQWIEEQDDSVTPLILSSYSEILSSLKNIFSDPSLRHSWLKSTKSSNRVYHDLLLMSEKFNNLLFKPCHHFRDDQFEDKGWYIELSDFEQKYKKEFYFEQDFKCIYEYFAQKDFKISRTPSGKKLSDSLKNLYQEYKTLKDFMKEYREDFESFWDNPKLVESYQLMLTNLVSYTSDKYSQSDCFTFADLEYLTLEGLNSPKALALIQDEYKYLVIDEFQDTSHIQYSIIKKIIGEDYNRLFCVGDPKQAIYGFRGGELSVFTSVQDSVSKNLSLLNNYRSDQDIINFNNEFYDNLFKLGLNYEGVDSFSVAVDYQQAPSDETPKGLINKHIVELDHTDLDLDKLNVEMMDAIEAIGILDNIKRNLASSDSIVILYRKLKPAKTLISLLMNNDIPFVSQVKIPLLEDPIFSIYYSLLRFQFNRSKKSRELLIFEIQSLLNLLFGQASDHLDLSIENYLVDKEYFGIIFAFNNFINNIGLATSNISNSLVKLEEIILSNNAKEENILSTLDTLAKTSYNLDFHYGKGAKKVFIMTAHASKGLQFSHVILGGIYTNDSSAGDSSFMGHMPESFQFKSSLNEKKKLKTPTFILSKIINALKEFSESKRLFYVASTRAEHSLAWIDIKSTKYKTSIGKNSWASGILNLEKIKPDIINTYVANSMVDHDFFLAQLETLEFSKSFPLFHLDTLGATPKVKSKLFLLPELSVTKFSVAAKCSRLFYFKNILKLSLSDTPSFELEQDNIEELSSKAFISSMQRGSDIHECISKLLKKEIILEDVEQKYQAQVKYAIDEIVYKSLKAVKNFELISEEETKFNFYGMMLAGIPDLIILNHESESIEIWDFKTGRVNESLNDQYWAQLYLYAFYAFNEKNKLKTIKPIKLVLCYVDEKRNLEQTVSFNDVDNYCYDLLIKSNQAKEKNPLHCSNCEYRLICQ